MIKPGERLTRRRLLHEMQQGAVLVRSFDGERGTTWSLTSGRGVAAPAAMAALQDEHVRGCGDSLWSAESMAQTYRWCGDARSEPPRIFVLRSRALPGIDAIKALRAALKHLLRRHGLRCESAHEEITDRQTRGDANGDREKARA
jgi:hypothetical protein